MNLSGRTTVFVWENESICLEERVIVVSENDSVVLENDISIARIWFNSFQVTYLSSSAFDNLISRFNELTFLAAPRNSEAQDCFRLST